MSGHEDVLRHAAELEELAKAMLNKVDALRTAHCRSLMRQAERETASPKVVAGPLRLVPTGEPQDPLSPTSAGVVSDKPRILTHPSCAAPCGGFCPDDEPPGAA